MNALRTFHFFTCVSRVLLDSGTCRGFWFGVVCLFVGAWFPPVLWFCFASARDFLTSFFRDTAIDDRQCFHARSASRYLKKKHFGILC